MAKPAPIKKERTNRSAYKQEIGFQPYNVTPETAHTAILLLESKEPDILCMTLRSLSKFCATNTENRSIIYNYDAIKYTLPHIIHPEHNIKRFALKLLAQLCQLPAGPEQLISDPDNVRKIAFLLARNEDIYVLEYASLLLAECTREPTGCDQVIGCNLIGVLMNRMKGSPDPDVQHNCLQVLANLLDDPGTATEVTRSSQFSWSPLLGLLRSPYIQIQQTTLRVINYLLSRYDDFAVQKSFKASTGAADLCEILERYDLRDIHRPVLDCLKTFVETEENAAYLYQTGTLQLLLSYLELALPQLKQATLQVLAKMSFTQNGRTALFETGTDLIFCHYLLSTDMEVLADSALGVANMCKLWASAVRMADTSIMEAIYNILSDEIMPWFDVRINTLLAVRVLCKIVPKAACAAVEPKSFNTLRNIHRKANTKEPTPIEAQRLAMQCYLNLQTFQIPFKAMLSTEFITEIIACLQKPDVQLKILAATVLTGLMADDQGKEQFTKKQGEKVLAENLKLEHVGLRTAMCQLLIASVTDDSADIYLEKGILQYMIENKKAQYVVSAWELAIEAIFKHHPSAKFAFTGRLDINDFTSDGFYAMKRLGKSFPTLSEILAEGPPYKEPVFVCTFLSDGTTGEPSVVEIRTPYGPHFRARETSSFANKTVSHHQGSQLQEDLNLKNYMLQLKIWFGDPGKSYHYIEVQNATYDVRYRTKCTEVSSTLKSRAQLLGEFVAQQMSGLNQERDCSVPSVELHLADLMMELKCRAIGIGYVKAGGALERAFLYKVLADRIGLPCSLNRAPNAHAWVEVAVPEIDPEENLEHEEKYPAGLLRANYIVDLVDQPGRLIPLSSHTALRFCGPSCTPLYVARAAPEVCKCAP